MPADCTETTVLPPGGAAVLRWAVVLVAAVVYLWLHAGASLTFPIPWPDEASAMWPAIAIERTGSLFAPQLNPERDVLWMPPGYMVVSGLIFKVFGFSLSRSDPEAGHRKLGTIKAPISTRLGPTFCSMSTDCPRPPIAVGR